MRTFKILLIVVVAILHLVPGEGLGNNDFQCSQNGRFADDNDSTCKHYFYCRVGMSGEWELNSYECPEGTIFDKVNGHCSSDVKCNADSSDSSDSLSASDDGSSLCKSPGLFDNKNDATCSSYYECKQNHKGVLFAVQYPCPPPSLFDPHLKHCSKRYTCPRHFRCTREGRFDDETDVNNKRYLLCLKKTNGGFSQTFYSCPFNSRFDSIDNVCIVPDEPLYDEDAIHDYNLPIESWDNLYSFRCSARGYYTNLQDNNCKTYHWCDVEADGKIVKYTLPCPRGYGWNRDSNSCMVGNSC